MADGSGNAKVVPDYKQIYRRSRLEFRRRGMAYGRDFLRDTYQSQWRQYNDNLTKVGDWLNDELIHSPKREDETKRHWLTRICEVKLEEQRRAKSEGKFDPEVHLVDLDFGEITMHWETKEIVTRLWEKLDQMRKKRNREERRNCEEQARRGTTNIDCGESVAVLQATERPLVEESDEQLVMAEMEKSNVHDMRSNVFKEIRYLRKYIPDFKRFDGYTKAEDSVRIHMLAEFYWDTKIACAAGLSSTSGA